MQRKLKSMPLNKIIFPKKLIDFDGVGFETKIRIIHKQKLTKYKPFETILDIHVENNSSKWQEGVFGLPEEYNALIESNKEYGFTIIPNVDFSRKETRIGVELLGGKHELHDGPGKSRGLYIALNAGQKQHFVISFIR